MTCGCPPCIARRTAPAMEHKLDEIIALATDAGRLDAEALTARVMSSKLVARNARKIALMAERKLSAARSAFLLGEL